MNSRTAVIDSYTTFGDLLKYLRIRADLTQRELSIAVGYSEAQISRQESNQRVPSAYVLKARFIPALGLDDEPETAARLLMLAEKARDNDRPITAFSKEENSRQSPTPHLALHNLPRQLTSFIGREKEINQVVKLVREHPLVTLTGAVGVEKTRLALHSAKELMGDFPDGIWLVELAPVIDPIFVPITVASIFNVHSAVGQRLVQTLREYLASKRLLLILDNCEHVIDAVAELSTSLLQGCPNLSILATSREILNVEGEFFFRCPSLSLPNSSPVDQPIDVLRQAETSEAAQLFVARAAAASPGFHLTEKNAAGVTEICRRLDGMPLAIELVAARLRLLSLVEIVNHMNDAFGLVAGSRRSVQPNHKTLKSMIDWSYHLLGSLEQTLLRRLSVFAGGWSLAAAQAVVGGDGVDPGEVLERMGQLVDKSLVFVKSAEMGENRYHFLETIRQYAKEKLQEAGEYNMARDRHLAFFCDLARQANPPDSHHFMSPIWAQRLMKELDNIRLALEWSLETNIELGLRLGISFAGAVPYNMSLELSTWLERFLAADAAERAELGNLRVDPQRSLLRGLALLSAGSSKMMWGLRSQSEPMLLESRTVFEAIGEPGEFWEAVSLLHLGTLYMCSDPEQSRIYLETSRDAFRRMGEKTYLSEVTRVLVALNCYTGHLKQAMQLSEEGLRISQEIQVANVVHAWEYAGNVAFLMGNYDQAIAYFRRSRESAFQYEDLSVAAYLMFMEGWVELARGNAVQALRLSEEMLALGRETGSPSMFLNTDTLLALLEWTQGSFDQAAQRSEEGLLKYHAEHVSYTVPFVYVLGRVALVRGDLAGAEQYFRQADDMADAPRWTWKAYVLHACGLLAAAQLSQRTQMAEQAAVLFGAQEKLFAWLPNVLAPTERDEYAKALSRVKKTLSEEVFLTAWARGQALSHPQAFALALEDMGGD